MFASACPTFVSVTTLGDEYYYLYLTDEKQRHGEIFQSFGGESGLKLWLYLTISYSAFNKSSCAIT